MKQHLSYRSRKMRIWFHSVVVTISTFLLMVQLVDVLSAPSIIYVFKRAFIFWWFGAILFVMYITIYRPIIRLGDDKLMIRNIFFDYHIPYSKVSHLEKNFDVRPGEYATVQADVVLKDGSVIRPVAMYLNGPILLCDKGAPYEFVCALEKAIEESPSRNYGEPARVVDKALIMAIISVIAVGGLIFLASNPFLIT